MKMRMTSIMMVLLITMLAVSAYAQSGTQNQVKPTEPIQEQTTPRTFDGAGNATGQASQTHAESGPEAALGESGAGAGVMDSRGTGSGVMGTALLGDDLLVKSTDNQTGDQTRNHSFDEDMGLGGTARHDEYAEEGGPHGLLSGDESAGSKGMFGVFIDEDMDGFADFPSKVLGDDGQGTMDGVIRIQGPGAAGPHSALDGFGLPNEETQDQGTGSSTRVRGGGRK